jgi:adenylate kinase
MTIALIGPSGAGKGTQAIKLTVTFDLLHISTGDLFRESLEKRTALGLLARRYMNQGGLVPDEVVEAVVEEWLWKVMPGKRILFDGFPRTDYQAKLIDKLFQETDRNLEAVIYLKVPDEEIIRRLQGRVICRICQAPYHLTFKPPALDGICDVCQGGLYRRTDDDPEIVRTRLKTSHREIGPLVNYYQETGKLIIVDGTGVIDDVYERLLEALQAVKLRTAPLATDEEMKQIHALKGEVTALSPTEAGPSLDIILIGGPGSGKGTQADLLQERLNLKHIATGNIFRENIKDETELGKIVKAYMNRGELVPDDVTERMVKERLSRPDVKDGCILDGFPRTIPQAEALIEIMNSLQRGLDGVFHIKVSDEQIIKRLSGRRICRNCQASYHIEFSPPRVEDVCDRCQGELYQRDDDNPDTVATRLKTYHAQTAPLIDYYRESNLLIEIEGESDVTEVTERLIAVAKRLVQAKSLKLTA